jgi:phasin family protein
MAARKGKTNTPPRVAKKAPTRKPTPSAAKPVVARAAEIKAEAAPVPAVEQVESAIETAAIATVEAAADIVAEAPEPVVQLLDTAPLIAEAEAEIAVETIEAIGSPATTIIDKGVIIMAKTDTAGAGKFTAERLQAAFGDVNERAKAAVEKSGKLLEEATELTKGNVEALVASSKIAAKGVETLSQEAADYGRRSFEDASAALKSFAEVKSPTDFFRLQSEFAKSAFDSMVSESSKLSEAVIKLAGDVAQPLTNRYSVAAERVKSIAA